MNTHLANAEVPGLFEGDEYSTLMTACKEGSQRDGLMLDSHEKLYRWFAQQVTKNLHVVFIMNTPKNGLASRTVYWTGLEIGPTKPSTKLEVGMEFTLTLDLDPASYNPPGPFPIAYRELDMSPAHRSAVISALVYMYQPLHCINSVAIKVTTFTSPLATAYNKFPLP